MKRDISILLVLLLCMAIFSACGKKDGEAPEQEQTANAGADAAQSEAPPPETAARLSDYYGCWEDGSGTRASMTIAPREESGDVEIVVHWNVSAREMNEWIMHGAFDENSGVLSYADAIKNRITWDDSLTDRTEPLRKNGSGTLTFADGGVRWTDAEEPESARCAFTRTAAELPTAQELIDGYFNAVGGERSDSGEASPERAACAALRFAYLIDARSQDSANMRVVLRLTWESLSGEEQENFLTNFSGAVYLIDKAASDYESVRGQFDAAGVGGEMKELIDSAYCRACWTSLCSDTVHMDSDL